MEILTIEPFNVVYFRGNITEGKSYVKIKLTNNSSTKIYFKIKTTRQHRYCVNPPQGIIYSWKQKKLIVRIKDTTLRKRDLKDDKFLILYISERDLPVKDVDPETAFRYANKNIIRRYRIHVNADGEEGDVKRQSRLFNKPESSSSKTLEKPESPELRTAKDESLHNCNPINREFVMEKEILHNTNLMNQIDKKSLTAKKFSVKPIKQYLFKDDNLSAANIDERYTNITLDRNRSEDSINSIQSKSITYQINVPDVETMKTEYSKKKKTFVTNSIFLRLTNIIFLLLGLFLGSYLHHIGYVDQIFSWLQLKSLSFKI